MSTPVSENGTPWNNLPGATDGLRRNLKPRFKISEQVEKMALGPLSILLAAIFDGEPEDWDTLAEIQDGFESWLENLPIIGDIDNIIDAIRAGVTGGTLPGGNPLADFFADVRSLFVKADDAETVANSADNRAGDALDGVEDLIDAIADDVGATLAAAQARLATFLTPSSTLLTDLGDDIAAIVENINTAVGGAGGSLPITQVFTDIASIVLSAFNATNQAVEAKAALAALLAAQQAAASGGRSDGDNMTRANSTSMGSDWLAFAQGAGNYGPQSNRATWQSSGNSAASKYLLFTATEYATDYQSASITLQGSWPIGSASILLAVRCPWDNLTYLTGTQIRGSNFVGIDFSNGSGFELVTCTGGVLTTRASMSYTAQAGDTIEVRAGTLTNIRQMQVLLNGTIVLSWTDPSTLTNLGAGYRYSALRPVAGGGFAAQAPPINVANFSMADTPAGTGITGVGWRLYRAATGSVTVTADTALPTLFDTSELGTGVTVTTLGPGVVTVPKTGWYQVKCGLTVGSLAIAAGQTRVVNIGCYVGGALVQRARTNRWTSGDTAIAANGHTADGDFIVFVQAGQTVSCRTIGSVSFGCVGSPGGDETYFAGSLMSPPGN